jgi:hypothetical protein
MQFDDMLFAGGQLENCLSGCPPKQVKDLFRNVGFLAKNTP